MKRFICILLVLFAVTAAHATEKISVIVVKNGITKTWTEADLLALPQVTLSTTEPDMGQTQYTYQGPSLLSLTGPLPENATVHFYAENDYSAKTSAQLITKYNPVVAIRMNGKVMHYEADRGPIRLAWPHNQYAELREYSVKNLFVWHLIKIVVR